MKINKVGTKGGINRVSLVKKPANEGNIIECPSGICSLDDNTISAPVLIPNQKIYRKDPERFIYFPEDAIKELASDFLANSKNDQLSTDHESMLADGISLAESWVTKEASEKYPKGTWMMTLKVEDPEIKKQIDDGTYTGYSIEAKLPEKTMLEVSEDVEKFKVDSNALDLQTKEEIFGQFINENK